MQVCSIASDLWKVQLGTVVVALGVGLVGVGHVRIGLLLGAVK